MKNPAAIILLSAVVICYTSQQACAGRFALGLGLGFAESLETDGFEGGWDLLAGYEPEQAGGWNMGTQLHIIRGWTDSSKANYDTNMSFNSTALYVTARPEIGWLQIKGGLVSADYKSLMLEGRGTGIAVGAGLVLGGEDIRFHLQDLHHFIIDGHRFNIYSVSLMFSF